jgi:hypothetical protein
VEGIGNTLGDFCKYLIFGEDVYTQIRVYFIFYIYTKSNEKILETIFRALDCLVKLNEFPISTLSIP